MNTSVNPNVVSGDQPTFRRTFERLEDEVDYAASFLTTLMPRGGLQIVQPAKTSESFLKAYHSESHEDVATWSAIRGGRAQRVSDKSPFFQKFIRPMGYRHAAVAPLQSPLINGYPGAIHLLRRAGQKAFTQADLARLSTATDDWQSVSVARRAARQGGDEAMPDWLTPLPTPFFVFDATAHVIINADEFDQLDDELRGNMASAAKRALKHLRDQPTTFERVKLADTVGDVTVCNVVAHSAYPALGAGPIIFVCQLPNCLEWGTLRSTDVPADPEFARLVPAVRFMQQEFKASPSLGDIALSVHLSPFHFHRRFTEILGLTPKHFMLDCQIFEAKTELLKGTDLAEIAADCGFAHQSHFTSRFKQSTGLTPTRWRRTMRLKMDAAGSIDD